MGNKSLDKIENVYEFFEKIQDSLETKNRFFPCSELYENLKEILSLPLAKRKIKVGTTYYRARIYHEEEDTNKNKPTVFKGYDEKGSFVNTDDKWPVQGRMNPEGIRVLYVSTDEKTCVKEVGAASGEKVSIATIQVIKELSIVDFEDLLIQTNDLIQKSFIEYIRNKLSSGYGGRDYVLTQYVASLCEHENYDGIKYRSKYATKNEKEGGMNVAIFHYEKCKAISSVIKKVKSIALTLEQ